MGICMQFGTIFYCTRLVTDTGFDELVLLKPGASGPFRGDMCRVNRREPEEALAVYQACPRVQMD